ncbi:MAG TPA: ATP-grasp domain-containing protein [Terriglobales bacterium]|nr:ATP-grasp domain-containing protein [Terriglobales bacterium]
MARVLLLSNTTGYQANAFKAAAERIGVEIVLASDRCHVLEDPWGDGAIPVRFQEPQQSAEKIADFARRYSIDAVVAIGDAPTMTAAFAAERLGLSFHPPHAVDACRNKWIARERFKATGLRMPWYKRFPADEDPAIASAEVPFPCVLKPLGLSASRGVIRANDKHEFNAAFKRIELLLAAADVRSSKQDSTQWIQVESYIPGSEFALEGLVTEGRLKVLALFDKPDPLEGPYFEETIYVTPSRLLSRDQHAIFGCAQSAISALGLQHGPVHAEFRFNEKGAWVLEVAARPIGGLCAKSLRFETEMALEELIIRHALGEDMSEIRRENAASGVMMIPIPAAGVYEGVENVAQAEKVKGIESVEITAKLQQKLVPLPEGASYLGFIFARGTTPEFVEEALREAHSKLQFQISAELKVV